MRSQEAMRTDRAESATPYFPFFVGRGRSGTTLLLAMFDSHSQMAIPYESHFTVGMALRRRRYETRHGFDLDRFSSDLAAHEGFRAWGLPEEDLRSALLRERPTSLARAMRAVYRAYAHRNDKSRYGEKTPGYVMHIPLLAEVFPEAKFVHIIRDGRNVALSYREAAWGPRDLELSAYYWRRFVQRGRVAGRRLGPDRYLEVRYERLVEDPEGTVRPMCRFLDLEFEPGMLRYWERADDVLRKMDGQPWVKGHQNLYRPPTKGLRDWRTQMSREDVLLFEELAGDLLIELGYERAFERIPWRARLEAPVRWIRIQARRAKGRLPRRKR